MACLGLDGSADPNNNILLPMAADPSSAEQFSFAFSGLGRDAYLAFDAPDRVGALRALLLDRTRSVSHLYDSTVQAICHLYDYRCKHHLDMIDPGDCQQFVRSFARLDMSSFSSDALGTPADESCSGISENNNCPAVMLPEKTLHSAAVEKFRNLMDSTELVGFAEACLVELLAEDVASASSLRLFVNYDRNLPCRLPEKRLPSPETVTASA